MRFWNLLWVASKGLLNEFRFAKLAFDLCKKFQTPTRAICNANFVRKKILVTQDARFFSITQSRGTARFRDEGFLNL